MTNDKLRYSPEKIRKLRDAAWAGLVQKMHEELSARCVKYGHEWIESPGNKLICKWCHLEKEAEDYSTS